MGVTRPWIDWLCMAIWEWDPWELAGHPASSYNIMDMSVRWLLACSQINFNWPKNVVGHLTIRVILHKNWTSQVPKQKRTWAFMTITKNWNAYLNWIGTWEWLTMQSILLSGRRDRLVKSIYHQLKDICCQSAKIWGSSILNGYSRCKAW